jgi:Ca-activated chloride channel family protein
LIISDGGDNHSRHRLKEIKKLVQDSDVDIYAIGVSDTGFFKTVEESMETRWLNKITDATGGQTVVVNGPSKVPEAAATISREMRDHYLLGYRPSAASRNSGRRKITVQVTPAEESMALHTYYKTGYTASEEEIRAALAPH